MENVITVKGLSKCFTFPIKDPKASWWKNLVSPEKKSVTAVDKISFEVGAGERLAFIGPNGAGKSTTIKMLTGILFPSEGEISVLGLNPTQQRKKLAYKIGTVFGQRSQLLPNLPLTDSLEFFGTMYEMSQSDIQRRIDELCSQFAMQDYMTQPVRKLSLGQRMRAEVASALMHKPQIIFLDEPTIGLDIVAKKSFREMLLKLNETEGTTLFLTSHDVGDIEALCQRTIVVNHGQIVVDTPTSELSGRYIRTKLIELLSSLGFAEFPALPAGLTYAQQSPAKVIISVDLNKFSTQSALQTLLTLFPTLADINIADVELEEVIRHIYERNKTS